MSDAPPLRDNDDTRPCTVCRMPVSILAVKCHHCGAQVGRPKEASRTVTIEELGGETVEHYAPSSNVMDALESFRSDETGTHPAYTDKKSKKGKKGEAEAPVNNDGLPELDERSQALASIAMPKSTAPPKKKSVALGDYLKYVVIAVIVILGGGAAFVYGPSLLGGGEVVDDFVSEVPMLRQTGASNLDILSAAVIAADRQPTQEHLDDLEQAQQDVAAEIRALLDAEEMTSQTLRDAASLASKAAVASPSDFLQELKREADGDNRIYRTLVTGIDFGAKEAAFRASGNTETVKRGDLYAERFKLDNVTPNSVRLVDTLRGNRRLEVRLNSPFL